MSPDDLRGRIQPDQRSCGPASLVAAHMLVNPEYRPASFTADVLAVHREVTSSSSYGHSQLPWPRALGTPPWAAARAMSSFTGIPYATRSVRFGSRGAAFAAVEAAVSAGRPCPMYVGDRWLPRHVVLAVAPLDRGGVQVYNPGRGTLVEVPARDFEAGVLTMFGRWSRPWFAVVPERWVRHTAQ